MNEATYDYLGNVLSSTDGNQNEITYTYNSLGKLRSITYPGDSTIPPNTIIYQYDVMGNLASQKDSLGVVDTYTYDNQGRNLSHTQSLEDGSNAITTSVKYDRKGNKRFETDGNGTTIEYTYDGMNRLTDSVASVSGILHNTHYEYDLNSNQTSVTDWRGNTSINLYDSLNRIIEKKDAYGKSIQKLEYNHNNAQSKSYDALGNLTSYTYDRNNRLLETVDPLGHVDSQSYDNAGNVSTKTDGRNNATQYLYDEFNRLSSLTNAKNEITAYTYDMNGNMLTQTDGKGQVTTFECNALNKVIRKINDGGRTGTPGDYNYIAAKTESYTYYADGNLEAKTDRNGNTTTYTYDIHGRLLSEVVGNMSISYTYDANGNQLTMTDSTGTTTRTYDELNRVLTKTVPDIGVCSYSYDLTQGLDEGCTAESSTDPKSHVTIKVYDKAGRMIHVTADNRTTGYEYYDNGSLKNVVYDGGAREDYTYYPNGKLNILTNKKADGTVIDTYMYEYDEAGNQISKIDGKGTTEYTYDALNRLETVLEPDEKETAYTFDAAGNRISETSATSTTTSAISYSYDELNRLIGTDLSVNGNLTVSTEYTYDNNGNQLTTEVNGTVSVTNTYDLLNRLASTLTNNTTMGYGYNGDGYRVSKTVNGTLTRYLYEYDKVVLETDGSGNETARNVYGLNLVTRTAGSEQYDYMYNGHADVTALLAPDGTVAGTYYYDAFGNILEQTGDVNNSITYAGYQYDSETGLYYLNARYYDSKIARFLSEDTYAGEANDPLSLNLYIYCADNPVIYTDPSGHVYLMAGATGDDVKVVQAALGVPVTGIYDQATINAVNSYKTKNGLGNSGAYQGVVGDQTYASIISGSVVGYSQTKAMQKAAGTSSSSNSYGMSSQQIASSVGVSGDVSFNVGLSVTGGIAGGNAGIAVTGTDFVNRAKPTNNITQWTSNSILFQVSDFNLKAEVQQAITYYDDMYVYADVAYESGIIDKYEYQDLKRACYENAASLRQANKLDTANNSFLLDVIITAGGFIPFAGPVFDALSSPSDVYAGSLRSSAIKKISAPNNFSKITNAIARSTKYDFKYTVYELYDEAGKVKYVGRTRQSLEARQKQHWKADSDNKYGLEIREAEFQGKTLKGLSYSEARGLEQKVFESRGGFDKLLNKIKPLDIDNPKIAKKAAVYLEAALEFLNKVK